MGKTMTRTKSKSSRKNRKTFSLSQGAVAFLKQLRSMRQAESLTAALETLILEEKERRKREELDAQFSAYYDSLTDEEVKEQREWAELTGRSLLSSRETSE